ncbi:TonB-dependent receptor [Erythrobacter sp. SCSIO 43205]|uniref:TonB-dependent receptor n=1 Tax=Erythrobacter sp. SCSIO 43205 TaxID=2779361 RepID=UPI001CA9E158|nr:TonB-dependent receptor [Erythrobacter sp. SCSIO 43205]UAB77670.1 TonB-dependent receptor [Erythrobacter sp. SCSIO 43205]
MKASPIAPSRRISALTTASGLALSMAIAAPAFAQDNEAGAPAEEATSEENVIFVDGFRASLESAQNIKENADTFVDVITAEDIGALPDRSVAETLQRIPGITIGRFEKTTDPDRFSVEGTGVIIRGLPYARSQLNGRDIFSANGGRVLSFNDVSPELLGRVEVFKNVTADMIEGGASGTVNLVTRKPLDTGGTKIAGTVGVNYGDFRGSTSPEFSLLGSTVWESEAGSLGFQLAYAQSELKSRTDASQITDPCYRDPDLSGGCFRAQDVNSGGFFGPILADEGNFPPAGSVLVPRGAGVRTTNLDRDREAWSAVMQYEDPTGDFIATFEWLRAETTFATDEYSLVSLVNDNALNPTARAGSDFTYDENGFFQSGTLTQRVGDAYATPFGRGGIPLEALRFQRATQAVTEDFSFDVKWNVTDRFRVNFEAQTISSDLRRDSIIGAMNTWADVSIDASGTVPQVQFLAPQGSPDDYFTSGFYQYYWFGLDSAERNEGDLDSLRFDAEYDISDDGFFKAARFGARWAERDRTTRNTNFSTWGNLSAPWAGRAGCAPWNAGPGCAATGGFQPGRFFTGLPGQEFAIAGGAYQDEFPEFSQLRNVFADNFQRDGVPAPLPEGGTFFYGGDDFLQDYLSGQVDREFEELATFSQTPEFGNYGIRGREGAVDGVFLPGDISEVTEITKAAYARIDYGHDFSNGWNIEGNFGLRYVETEVRRVGGIQLPDPSRFDGPQIATSNNDGVVTQDEVLAFCDPTELQNLRRSGQGSQRGFCELSPDLLSQFVSAHTGEVIVDNEPITFNHWLPSFNAKLDVGDGLLFRAAVSRNIDRPDLQFYRSSGGLGDLTDSLISIDGDGLVTEVRSGPLFGLQTGNRNLLPVSIWNYDLSAEWYFNAVGSITATVFAKDVKGFIDREFTTVSYPTQTAGNLDVQVDGPANTQDGWLTGFEFAWQQTFDFLPGPLDGLGMAATYTYVDAGDFSNPLLAAAGQSSVTSASGELNAGPFVADQPLAGVSKHAVNATIFYEKYGFSARAAYNWRSAFLITVRDDIYPFSPIWQEATGQLDASLFYDVTDNIKVGVQGVNLLDEVTETSQVVDYTGNRVTRSAFRNDRRYTFLVRFDF